MKTADRVKVTTFVEVEPARAFEVFTTEVDLWWRRGPKYRTSDRQGTLRFEPGAGGRLVEAFEDGEVFEIGRVLAWEPAAKLVLEWRARNFARDERTEVEVRFQAARGGTQVTIEHSGWAAIREDHPARHGYAGGAFLSMIGLWWGELATSLRAHAAKRRE
jgi:activator of HSP90 ATPase